MNGSSSDSAMVYTYLIEGNTLTPVFNWTSTKYLMPPSIEVSPKFTNIFIVGNGNMSNGSYGYVADAFRVDWTTKTYQNITFPYETLEFGMMYFVAVGE